MRLRNLSRLAAGYLYYGRQGKQTPQETQYIYDGEDTIFLKNSKVNMCIQLHCEIHPPNGEYH